MIHRIVLSAAFLFGTAQGADNLARDVSYTLADPCHEGGCPMPSVDKGYLLQAKPPGNAPLNGFDLFDRTGSLAYQVDIVAPDGSPGHIPPFGWSAGTDGTLLVPISYGGYGGNGHVKGGGIVVLDPAGSRSSSWTPAAFCPTPRVSRRTIPSG